MYRTFRASFERQLLAATALAAMNGTAVAADVAVAAGGLHLTATVQAIDQVTRTVTLQDAEGHTTRFIATPEVRNLAQVAVGDRVTLDYAQAVAVSLKKSASTIRERGVTEDVERAAPGQKPGGIANRQVHVVASVEAIDRKARVVTLRGTDNTVDVKVEDPEILARIATGDFVDAVYVEAVVVNVVAAKK